MDFDYLSLKLIYNYPSGRLQRVTINSQYISWSYILFGVPHGSILGSLPFNIYLCDLFLFLEDPDIANYADDNSPFACELDKDSRIFLHWIRNNGLKTNPDKFHLHLTDNNEEHFIKVANFTICNSTHEKLLGIIFDELSFEPHVSEICTKGSQRLHALSRVCNLSLTQRKLIIHAFGH